MWRRLTEPFQLIEDIEHRRNTRLVATMSLVLMLLVIILQVPYIITDVEHLNDPNVVALVIFLAGCTSAYVLSRQGRYIFATQFIIVLITLTAFALVGSSDNADVEYLLYYLVLPIIIAGFILPPHQAVFFTIGIITLTAILPLFTAHLVLGEMPVLFLMMFSAIAFLLGEHRRRINLAQHEEIRARETRYQKLFEVITDGLFVHENGIFVNGNPALYALTGYEPADLEGSHILNFVEDDLHQAIQNHIEQDYSTPLEIRIRCKDGTLLDVEVYGHNYEENGRRLRISTMRDITARKANAQREMALQVEREHNALLRRFITDASHDLRTPLTVMFSSLHLLTVNPDPASQKRYIESLTRQAQHMRDIVDSLLNSSRLAQASAHDYLFEEGDINALVQQAYQSLTPYAETRPVKLTLKLKADLPFVVFDHYEMMRVLRQLITNAISYTPPAGEVTIGTSMDEKNIVIRVCDTGIGIAPEHLPHIFELFYRVDQNRSTESGGMGLGLAICQQVMEAHGGKISATSTLGEGSIFTVTLPLV